jgi:hypothetical protein
MRENDSLIVRWKDEWDASEELQFQHPLWNSYVYQCARKHWDAKPCLQSSYGDFNRFMTDLKRESSEVWGARRKAEQDARQHPHFGCPARTNLVTQFTDRLMNRKSKEG